MSNRCPERDELNEDFRAVLRRLIAFGVLRQHTEDQHGY
jgi:hypothetical protein